jgi:hypothetical protein
MLSRHARSTCVADRPAAKPPVAGAGSGLHILGRALEHGSLIGAAKLAWQPRARRPRPARPAQSPLNAHPLPSPVPRRIDTSYY